MEETRLPSGGSIGCPAFDRGNFPGAVVARRAFAEGVVPMRSHGAFIRAGFCIATGRSNIVGIYTTTCHHVCAYRIAYDGPPVNHRLRRYYTSNVHTPCCFHHVTAAARRLM